MALRTEERSRPLAITAAPDRAPWRFPWRAYVEAVASVLLVTLAGKLVGGYLSPANLVMFYLPAVVVTALRHGWRPAVVASALSVLAFNFFFVPPVHTLHVQDPQYLVTFGALLLVGLTIGNLTAVLREQVQSMARSRLQIMASYSLGRELARAASENAVVIALMRHLDAEIASGASLLVPRDGHLEVHPMSSCSTATAEEIALAEWAWRHRQPAGWGTATLGSAPDIYHPIVAEDRCLGILCVRLEESSRQGSPGRWKMLESMVSLTGLALERVRLAEEARRAQLLEESEKLHSALLNSISHDLHTPLTSLLGCLDTLRDPCSRAREEDREALVESAYEQAQRLKGLVANLLDMTRVESGRIRLERDYCEVSDLIGAALEQLEEPLRGRTVTLELPAQVPLVKVDGLLMIQVLVNLLDNAARYSSGAILVAVRRSARTLEIAVADRGPGVPLEDRQRIFEKFVRGRSPGVPGSGLGLAICRGLVDCHRGRLWVEDTPGGGATFVLELPLEEPE